MSTYIAFLRAVNLGKNRKLPMADARAWLSEAGLGDVETYIQTGNLRFTTPLRSRSKVERLVEDVLGERCGFDVPAMAFTAGELQQVYADAAALAPPIEDVARQYVTFLKEAPSAEVAAPIDGWDHDGEAARVVGRAVHWWLSKASQDARISNARIEKALGLIGTTRDLKVVTTLADRWGC
ncbi:MAG TPA: DUF1697 domain-containing protein [Nocardioidaceae bacterium]|nr:DUF1697 domain-containing protein [Nocardioidaceae bacterium]